MKTPSKILLISLVENLEYLECFTRKFVQCWYLYKLKVLEHK